MSISKDQIIAVSARLFQEKGYAATSVQDIAGQLGCTKAALYYYVESKEQVLCEIFERAMTTAENRFEETRKIKGPIEQIIRGAVRNHCRAVLDEIPLMAVFFNERAHLPIDASRAIAARLEDYENHLIGILEAGMEAGVVRRMPTRPMLNGILGVCNWLYRWYQPDGPIKPDEITEFYAEFILRGIRVS